MINTYQKRKKMKSKPNDVGVKNELDQKAEAHIIK